MRVLRIALALILLASLSAQADQSVKIIKNLRGIYSGINDYRVKLNISVNGPNISINKMLMKIYYKRPNKLKVIAPGGIGMLPAGLPIDDSAAEMLKDSTSTYLGSEEIDGKDCYIIKLSPNARQHHNPETTIWVNKEKNVIVRSYAKMPTEMLTKWTYQRVDGKFYLPKKIDVETTNRFAKVNGESQKVKMTAVFSNYIINKGIKDSFFTKED